MSERFWARSFARYVCSQLLLVVDHTEVFDQLPELLRRNPNTTLEVCLYAPDRISSGDLFGYLQSLGRVYRELLGIVISDLDLAGSIILDHLFRLYIADAEDVGGENQLFWAEFLQSRGERGFSVSYHIAKSYDTPQEGWPIRQNQRYLPLEQRTT